MYSILSAILTELVAKLCSRTYSRTVNYVILIQALIAIIREEEIMRSLFSPNQRCY